MSDDSFAKPAVTVLTAMTVLASLPSVFLGVAWFAQDTSASGEWLDGVGLVFGLALLGATSVPLALAASSTVLARRQPSGAVALGVLAFAGAGLLASFSAPVLAR
jgi:hypothetical protein